MDFAEIQSQLNDLPNTFKRTGAPYTQWIDALTAGLALFGQGADGLIAQLVFAVAAYGWLDAFGTIMGIPRRANEADKLYRARITNELTSGRATPVAMVTWFALIDGLLATIVENLPSVGYTITIPPTLTPTQVAELFNDLKYVRPAGVPITIGQITAGETYLNTVNYMGHAPRVTGSYFASSVQSFAFTLNVGTNSAAALLPDLLFTDPLINPSLAPAA